MQRQAIRPHTAETISAPILSQSLAHAELAVERLQGQDGSSVIPHGGRVIGLFGRSSDENFLWNHPDLAAGPTATSLFRSLEWHNSGGDRSWLAPEIDHFFPDYPDSSNDVQPRQFDPGNFQRLEPGAAERCTLQDQFELTSYRSGRSNSVILKKVVSLAANPLGERCGGGIDFAGYRLETTLQLRTSMSDSYEINIWNLLQLPHGGEMIVPTYHHSQPTIFFGRVPPAAIQVSEHGIRYRMNADGEQKIGVKALACVGRVGYRYQCGVEAALVVRQFSVMPSSAYLDAWVDNPAETGFAFQACNICNPTLGHFSELEYHAPAIGGCTGSSYSHDVSEVWAFRGPVGKIDEISRLLLGNP